MVGEDFHFGHQRSGNVALLREIGAVAGFDVVGLELVGADGRRRRPEPGLVDRIRAALADGDLDAATAMLGPAPRGPWRRSGTATSGPANSASRTANVAVPDVICLPADGVYAGWYRPPDGVALPHGHLARSAPDVLRARRHVAARGPPARLRR